MRYHFSADKRSGAEATAKVEELRFFDAEHIELSYWKLLERAEQGNFRPDKQHH